VVQNFGIYVNIMMCNSHLAIFIIRGNQKDILEDLLLKNANKIICSSCDYPSTRPNAILYNILQSFSVLEMANGGYISLNSRKCKTTQGLLTQFIFARF
jgi:hypothetical protein